MKNLLLFILKKQLSYNKFVAGFILILLFSYNYTNAQVGFVQTYNADFNKGIINNAVISSDNVYLQNYANGVGNWLTTTVLPQTLTGHKTVTWNDRYVYMIGGYNNTNYVNTVYVATLQSGGISSWSTLNPLPVALRDPAVVIATNTIYVMGGRDASQVYNTIYYANLNSDGSIGAWQTSAVSLPVNLWGHTATYAMGHIYVIGGSSSLTESTALSNVYYTKVNALNTLSAFSTGTALPAARNRHSTVTFNNKLYVLGGYNNSGTKYNTVYIATPGLNGSTGSWTSGTDLPVAVSNHSAVVNNGVISVMAGAVGSTLSNTVYYSDAVTLSWNTSTNVMYDYTKDGATFAGNGIIFYAGGTNLSGTPILNCRYSLMSMTSNYVNYGTFISSPFYELGADRIIDSLQFYKSYSSPANLQIQYRTASADGIFGDWSALTAASPVTIGQTKYYLQYQIIMTGSGTNNSTLNEVRLYTPGTQLSGNLNGISTFTKALSPYWATSDISFTSGTHTFQAGTTILFLPNTGMYVNQASIICGGTAADSVRFTYFTNETGKWNGIYFDDYSDNGVSSQLNYTVITNAGNGSRNTNLYCNYTNEPLLSNCNIYNADGNGIVLNYSHITIQNTSVKSNTENGIYLSSSNPIIISSQISNNLYGGMYLTSASSVPNYASSSLIGNTYGILYGTSNVTLNRPLGTLSFTGNTYNGIAIPGGNITDNNRWNTLTVPIFVLDNLYIGQYNGVCRLTIEPGNTIKIANGKKIQIGQYSSYHHAGELYAIGTVDSTITFTPMNGVSGGWEGLYFEDRSDYWGATSVMDYCIIEKGNAFNVYCENTTQPTLNHSILRNALQDGYRNYNSYASVLNSSINTNGRFPVYFSEPLTSPTLSGNTYTGNIINMMGYCGGSITENRTFVNDGIPYYVMDNIIIGKYDGVRRLTINKGLTVKFASGKGIQVGTYSGWYYGGELYAIGNADSIITFTPYSGIAGDWNGIYFEDRSDWNGATNQLQYCKIEKANTYNIYVENTGSVTIDHCTITNAITDGLKLYSAYGSYTNNTISNNGRYPVYYTEWSSSPTHFNNAITGNGINLIALSGGTYSENRSITKDGTDYLLLDNIIIGRRDGVKRLTIDKGITLKISSGKRIQIGQWTDWYNGGELYAIGNADSMITFTPYSGIAGDWNGIYFEDRSDWNGATNQLQYCKIEKANEYNVYLENTGSVNIDHCILSNAISEGLKLYGAYGSYTNNSIINNGRYPVYYTEWSSSPTHFNNTITGNGINLIALSGGTYTENRSITKDGTDYLLLDNIIIGRRDAVRRLTIDKGITLNISSGKGFQIGLYTDWYNGGELYAVGTKDSVITFRPYSGIAGDWNGLYFEDRSDWGGSTSYLKYCNIEKGLNYNIRAEYTTMPVIDHCNFTGSLGNGINVLGNSSITISSSNFTNNNGYGLYFDATATANIGNTDSTSCNIFGNKGLYELYNNSSSDINARYNYWGTGDSTLITLLKIYDKSDNAAKGRVNYAPFAQLPGLAFTNSLMNGSIKYANTGANPIKNASLTIKNYAGTTIASTTSNTSGNYSFTAFPSGYYKLSVEPAAAWGGVNSSDALLILNHFAMLTNLTGMNLAAADVNASNTINGTDALFVMKRYAGMISSFPSGNYLHHSDTVYTNGNQITNNLKMICYGDVNASYEPAKKSSGSLGLINEGNLILSSNTEFDLPVKIKTGMNLGAISLGFYYPQNYIEVLGIEMNSNTSNNGVWHAENGLFRMGWCDLSALNLQDNDVFVTLKLKTKDISMLNTDITLSLYEECELADNWATANDLAVISVPGISNIAQNVPTHTNTSVLSVFPNPVRGKSTISFNLDINENIKITLCDIMGRQISTIASGVYTSGNHNIELNSSGLKPGVYMLTITREHNEKVYSDTYKMIVSY